MEKLEEDVREAKRNREWRHEYITLLMRDQENVEKGEERLARLIKLLSEDNRLLDILDNIYAVFALRILMENHIISKGESWGAVGKCFRWDDCIKTVIVYEK